MVRNIYEDTIFVITNKLNNKLDVLLSSSNDKHNMDIDQSVIEFAKSLVTLITYSSKS